MKEFKYFIIAFAAFICIITGFVLVQSKSFIAKSEPIESNESTVDGLIGDVNNDGDVNAIDAQEVLTISSQMALNGTTEVEYDKKIADVDGNNTIDTNDAAIILKYSAALGAGEHYESITEFYQSIQ